MTIICTLPSKEINSMLLEFTCSNYRSIKDKITFSMIAGKDTTAEDTLIMYDKFRVLRSSAIYGANGSGKSTFVDAIHFVRSLILNSINHQPGQGIFQLPNKLLSVDQDSTFTIQFVKDQTRYAFGFTVNKMLISDEYLYYFPRGRQVVIYERDENNFYPGDRFKGKFESCKDVLKPNRLFFSCAANFSAVPEIESAYAFFRDDLVVYRGLGTDDWMNYSLNTISQDPRTKELVIDFLHNLGTGIKDIEINKTSKAVDPAVIPPFLSDEFKAFLTTNEVDVFDTRIVYDKFSVELQYESTGIRKLIEFVCPLVDILRKGKVLICDEMEASFHESIVYGIVSLFKIPDSANSSQIIFTTHDTSILDLNLFRRDQIWFTELTKDNRSTDLYSLAEIKNVRKDENVGKGYISGKYGAIPMLNANLANIVSQEENDA